MEEPLFLSLRMNTNPIFIDIVFDGFDVGLYISCQRKEPVKYDVFIRAVKSANEDRHIRGIGHTQKPCLIPLDLGTRAFRREADTDFIGFFYVLSELFNNGLPAAFTVNGIST